MSIFDIPGTVISYVGSWIPDSSATSSDDSSYLTDQKIQEQFDKFKLDYQKSYESRIEEARRFNIFRENLIFIHKHNQQPNVDYMMDVNEFADLSFGEFKGSKLGYSSSAASKLAEHRLGFHVLSNEELPEYLKCANEFYSKNFGF